MKVTFIDYSYWEQEATLKVMGCIWERDVRECPGIDMVYN